MKDIYEKRDIYAACWLARDIYSAHTRRNENIGHREQLKSGWKGKKENK